jgi:hypothetical protein
MGGAEAGSHHDSAPQPVSSGVETARFSPVALKVVVARR